MIRTIHTGLLLAAAAVGLGGGAIACGTSSASGDPSQAPLGVDASVSANVDAAAAPAAPAGPFAISDCSAGQAVAIARAIIGAQLSSASQAAMLSMNPDVQRFARQVIDDARRFQQQLQSSDIQPVESDISQQILAQARASVVGLRATPDVDRNFLASQIVSDMTALAFIDHLRPSGGAQGQGAPAMAQGQGAPGRTQTQGDAGAMPPSGQGNPDAVTSFATDSRNTVQSHLQTALQLQRKLVGACGTFAPAPMGAPSGASMGGPSGAPMGAPSAAPTGAAPTGAAAEAGAPASSITPRPY